MWRFASFFAFKKARTKKLAFASFFVYHDLIGYLFPPMSRPGFRRLTMSLFECFFGERVF